MKSQIKATAKRFVDPDVWLTDHPTSYRDLLVQRARYSSVSRGVPLTANDRKLAKYRNCHCGERIWVIGNGPSIIHTDLSYLKDAVTIGTNSIFLNRDRMGFDVSHYVVEDYLVAEDRVDDIVGLQGPTKWFGNYLRYCLPDMPDALWMNVSVDYHDTPDWPRFSRDLSRIAYVGGTVTYLCIQLAYFLGAAEVVVVGLDHSYVVEDDETPDSGNTIVSDRDDQNHFHPDYFGKGKRWHLPRVDRMERAYVRAREVFAADGRRIKYVHNVNVPSFDTTQEVTCPNCSAVAEKEVPFSVGWFWSN